MPVVSLNQRVETTVQAYLEEVVPEDIEVIFTTAIFEKAETCEHESVVFSQVLWVTLWLNHPAEPERPTFKVVGHIPARLILDGDMDPIAMMMEDMWGKANFGSIMTSVEYDLERVAQSENEG